MNNIILYINSTILTEACWANDPYQASRSVFNSPEGNL